MNTEPPSDDQQDKPLSGKEVYNLVTDVAIGPNIRLRDNLVQAAVIVVCTLLGTGIGALLIEDRIAGCLVGGFVGLLAGLLGSGLFLMIYRMVRHARGKHD